MILSRKTQLDYINIEEAISK